MLLRHHSPNFFIKAWYKYLRLNLLKRVLLTPKTVETDFFTFCRTTITTTTKNKKMMMRGKGKNVQLIHLSLHFGNRMARPKRFWKPMWKTLKLAAKKSTVPSAFESKKYAGSNILLQCLEEHSKQINWKNGPKNRPWSKFQNQTH